MVTRVLLTFDVPARGRGGNGGTGDRETGGDRTVGDWTTSIWLMKELAVLTAEALYGTDVVEAEARVIWEASLRTLSVRLDTPAGLAVARVMHSLLVEQFEGCVPLPWKEEIWAVPDRTQPAEREPAIPGVLVPEAGGGRAVLRAEVDWWKRFAPPPRDQHDPRTATSGTHADKGVSHE